MLSRSKQYVGFVIATSLVLLLLIFQFFNRNNEGVFMICLLLLGITYTLIHNKIQIIVCMYLREKNIDIYDKYKSNWKGIRGYYPLASINLFKLNKKDLSEITDNRIIQLIYAKRKAYCVGSAFGFLLVGLMIAKMYKYL